MITHAVRCSVSALAISLAVGAIAFAPAAYAQTQSPRYAAPQEQYHAPQTRDQRDRRGDENRLDRNCVPAPKIGYHACPGNGLDSIRRRTAPEAHEHADELNAVGQLEQCARMLETRSAETEKMARALRPLYDSFSEDQKRIANQVLFRPDNE